MRHQVCRADFGNGEIVDQQQVDPVSPSRIRLCSYDRMNPS
jgi:hypothetical protein